MWQSFHTPFGDAFVPHAFECWKTNLHIGWWWWNERESTNKTTPFSAPNVEFFQFILFATTINFDIGICTIHCYSYDHYLFNYVFGSNVYISIWSSFVLFFVFQLWYGWQYYEHPFDAVDEIFINVVYNTFNTFNTHTHIQPPFIFLSQVKHFISYYSEFDTIILSTQMQKPHLF